MKKIFLVSLLLGLVSSTTFSQNTSKLIIGTWKPDVEVFKQILEKGMQNQMEKAETEQEKAQIEQGKPFLDVMANMMGSIRVTFKPGGVLESKSPKSMMESTDNIEVKKGTWRIVDDGQTIITKMEDKEKEENQKIVSISADKLVMENADAPADSPMKQMTFIRVK